MIMENEYRAEGKKKTKKIPQKRHFWWAELKKRTPVRGKVEKYYKPEKVLSIFHFFSAFLAAAHCVAIISKADCGSNSELVSGGNASPTSCGFTHI